MFLKHTPMCVCALCLTSSGTNSTNLVNHVSSHWADYYWLQLCFLKIYVDIMEKQTANQSSIVTWEISWTEQPGWLQFTGAQRVRYNLATKTTMTWISTQPPWRVQQEHCFCRPGGETLWVSWWEGNWNSRLGTWPLSMWLGHVCPLVFSAGTCPQADEGYASGHFHLTRF